MMDERLWIRSQNVRRRPVRKMAFKIVAGVSWLVLLIVTIQVSVKLAKSRQEIEDLSGRLKSVAEETAADEAALAAQAKAQTELDDLKETLSTLNGKMELLQKHADQEREKILQITAKERETLTASFAKALSRFGLSRVELETLLDDLPATDRLRLLEQITTPEPTEPEEAEPPLATEIEVTPPTNDEPEKKPALAPQNEPERAATYTVKRGDNLTRIARSFDVNVAQLMKLNGISNANMLRVGQVLKIPQK
jgi:LysM repeat protein